MLDNGFNINTSTNVIALYSFMALINGVYISSHGLWLINGETEYFLSYTDFPWFKDAPIGRILNNSKK